MLVLNLKTVKHSQHITVSAYLNSDTNYSQRPCLKKIGNYQQTFHAITKVNGKNENRDKINT